SGKGIQLPGIKQMVLAAVKTRALPGSDETDEGPLALGPPKVGGLYGIGVMSTGQYPTCLTNTLKTYDLPADKAVLDALYRQWQTDKATRDNLNIISGDFVDQTDLVKDAIAMDASLPVADGITRVGDGEVSAEQDSRFASRFPAYITFHGRPAAGARVTYAMNPQGSIDGAATATVTSSEDGEVKLPLTPSGLFPVSTGPRAQVTTYLVAWIDGATTENDCIRDPSQPCVEWKLKVLPSSKYTLQADPDNPTTAQVGSFIGQLNVYAVNSAGDPVSGVPLKYDATGVGTFQGSPTATKTTGGDGSAYSPAFTAGIHAGSSAISVTGPGAPTLSLPLRLTAGPPDSFAALTGDDQSAPVNTAFPIALTGHYLDKYGNVVTGLDPSQGWANVGANGGGKWPNGLTQTRGTFAADGTLTAPTLTAGPTLRGQTNPLLVKVGPDFFPWQHLYVIAGEPAAVTATDGDGQTTGIGQAFGQRLAARVTDPAGNPIPGAAVTFKVTSGPASWPTLLTSLGGDLATPGSSTSITEPTDVNGFAFANGLMAGQQPGDVVVTASADGWPTAKTASFSLHVVSFKTGGRGARPVHATICSRSAASRNHTSAGCASRTLIGVFPSRAANAKAMLTRGTVVYAVGRATSRYRKVILYRRRRLTAGPYTAILRTTHRTMIVSIVLRPAG
ncbi:MAG: hypothetical protein ACRDPA_16150, partial [Solirubrobacteraceae bacterium]